MKAMVKREEKKVKQSMGMMGVNTIGNHVDAGEFGRDPAKVDVLKPKDYYWGEDGAFGEKDPASIFNMAIAAEIKLVTEHDEEKKNRLENDVIWLIGQLLVESKEQMAWLDTELKKQMAWLDTGFESKIRLYEEYRKLLENVEFAKAWLGQYEFNNDTKSN